MRYTLALCASLLLANPAGGVARGQQPPSPRNPVANEWQEYEAKRSILQARAKTDACTGPGTTYDTNVCYEKQVRFTDQNFKQYEKIIRQIIALAPEGSEGSGYGASGPDRTYAGSAAEFDNVEQAWDRYSTVACQAARDQVFGGTAEPMYEMQCDLDLDRSHMRELDSIYWLELHK